MTQMKSTLESIIETAEESAAALRELQSSSPRIGNAISALGAVKDNLKWEMEENEKARKRESEQTGGNAPSLPHSLTPSPAAPQPQSGSEPA